MKLRGSIAQTPREPRMVKLKCLAVLAVVLAEIVLI